MLVAVGEKNSRARGVVNIMKSRVVPAALTFAFASLLASCGGGDGSSAPPGGAAPPPPPPTLNVSLSQGAVNVAVEEGGEAEFGFDATYTGSSTDPIVADVAIDSRRYRLAGAPTVSGKTFTVRLETLPFPAGGASTSTVTFRLCKASDCKSVYPGSTKTFSVNLDVAVADWGMFQRNAAHTGMVNVRYDPEFFKFAWEWPLPNGGRIQEPSAMRGKIFATAFNPMGDMIVYALNTADGTQAWATSLGEQSHVSGPSYADGKVHVSSMVNSSGNNPQWILGAEDGSVINQGSFASQWNDFGQPTVFENSVFVAAGYFGNVVYSFDTMSALKNWEANGAHGSIWDSQSVAVDEKYVYYYSGSMDVFDRMTGALVKSMEDPAFDWRGYSWDGAPILGENGQVFGFSSPHAYEWDSKLAGYSFASGRQTWISARTYTTAPALKGNRLFAARAGQSMIDALKTEDGTVAFSIAIPDNQTIASNLVLTNNLLFAATATKIYAFDLTGTNYPVVWEADGTGFLAITPDNRLLVAGEQKLRVYDLF